MTFHFVYLQFEEHSLDLCLYVLCVCHYDGKLRTHKSHIGAYNHREQCVQVRCQHYENVVHDEHMINTRNVCTGITRIGNI